MAHTTRQQTATPASRNSDAPRGCRGQRRPCRDRWSRAIDRELATI